MLEDGPGGGGAEDDGDDSAGATAAWTVEDVGAERPAEELGPGDGAAGTSGTSWWREVKGRGLVGDGQGRGRWRGRNDGGPQPGIGSEDAEVAHQVRSGGRNEGGEAAEKGERGHHEVSRRGRPLHPVSESSIGKGREALEGQRPPGTVGAEPLQPEDVVFVEPGVGVQREALDESTAAAGAAGRLRPGGRRLQCLELEEFEGFLGGGLLLEEAAGAQPGRNAPGQGGGEPLHLGAAATDALGLLGLLGLVWNEDRHPASSCPQS